MSKLKIYDVSFRTVLDPIVAVEAENATEAKRLAEELLEEMDKNEILDRYLDAIEYDCVVKITETRKV